MDTFTCMICKYVFIRSKNNDCSKIAICKKCRSNTKINKPKKCSESNQYTCALCKTIFISKKQHEPIIHPNFIGKSLCSDLCRQRVNDDFELNAHLYQ
jgi:hypothetical protein